MAAPTDPPHPLAPHEEQLQTVQVSGARQSELSTRLSSTQPEPSGWQRRRMLLVLVPPGQEIVAVCPTAVCGHVPLLPAVSMHEPSVAGAFAVLLEAAKVAMAAGASHESAQHRV